VCARAVWAQQESTANPRPGHADALARKLLPSNSLAGSAALRFLSVAPVAVRGVGARETMNDTHPLAR